MTGDDKRDANNVTSSGMNILKFFSAYLYKNLLSNKRPSFKTTNRRFVQEYIYEVIFRK